MSSTVARSGTKTPKTPKNSKPGARAPKTPKGAARVRLAPDDEERERRREQKRARRKDKSECDEKATSATEKEEVASKKRAVISGEDEAVDNETQVDPANKRKKRESSRAHTMLEGVDPKSMPGQFTRTRDSIQSIIDAVHEHGVDAADMNLIDVDGGVVDIGLNEEQLEALLDIAPGGSRPRVSRNSVDCVRLMIGTVFEQRVKELLPFVGDKKTLSTMEVWREQLYREGQNLSMARAVRSVGGTVASSMVELAAETYPAGGDDGGITQKGWDMLTRAKRLIGKSRPHASDTEHVDLKEAATEYFGGEVAGPWE